MDKVESVVVAILGVDGDPDPASAARVQMARVVERDLRAVAGQRRPAPRAWRGDLGGGASRMVYRAPQPAQQLRYARTVASASARSVTSSPRWSMDEPARITQHRNRIECIVDRFTGHEAAHRPGQRKPFGRAADDLRTAGGQDRQPGHPLEQATPSVPMWLEMIRGRHEGFLDRPPRSSATGSTRTRPVVIPEARPAERLLAHHPPVGLSLT